MRGLKCIASCGAADPSADSRLPATHWPALLTKVSSRRLCLAAGYAVSQQHQPQHDALAANRQREGCKHHASHSHGGQHPRRALIAAACASLLLSNQPPAVAAQQSDIQAAYDSYAPTYDDLDGGGAASALGFDQLRAQLLAGAQGQVVEIAVGTGLNIPYYQWGPSKVSQLLALDLSSGMLAQAQARMAANPSLSGLDISFQQADATALPLADDSADTVVDTFSLCVIPDPLAALQQMARIVRSQVQGGRVLLLEHTRSDNPLLGAYQDLTASTVAATAKGCVWNQDIPALLRAAGLTPTRMERHVAGTILLVEAVKA